MDTRSKKAPKFWCKVFLASLLVVFLLRAFVIQSFTISSNQMANSLLNGDRVLVNNLAYGMRMPVTPLAIPFTFDSVCGLRTYSRSLEFEYHRFLSTRLERNDVIVFNNPLETDKPLDRRSLCISRCVAGPGNKIQISGFDFKINGKQYPMSPDLLASFSYPRSLNDTLRAVMNKQHVEEHNFRQDSNFVYVSLNRHEADIVNQNLKIPLQLLDRNTLAYTILIPSRSQEIKLTDLNIPFYRSIILVEQGSRARFDGFQLYIDGNKYSSYRFKYDYYWLLSDNVNESLDSRHLGLISETSIIGKVSLILYSVDHAGHIRWDRLLSNIF